MPGDLWMQGAWTLLAALTASFVFLLYRYHDAGRPFGSRRSALWSLAVILVMALIATALGLGLPVVAAAVPPVWVGLIAPAMLGAHRMERNDQPPDGREMLFGVVTIGLKLLLDRLEWRMSLDRENWCSVRLGTHWSMEQLDDAGLDLYTTLCQRVPPGGDKQQRLRSDYDALCQAILHAEKVASARDYRRARHTAEQAFLAMLGLAYDWSHTDVKPSPLRGAHLDEPADRPALGEAPRRPRGRLDPT
jgi:hypothetical protein